MNYYQNRKIIYSFEYGGYSKKKERVILCCAFALIILIGLSLSIISAVTEENFLTNGIFWLGIVFSLVLGIFPLMLVLFVPLKEHINDKIISQWLKTDSITLLTVKPFEYQVKKTVMLSCVYKIGVNFEMDGTEYFKVSKKFDAFYKSIENREIDILYIPKYEQVLILES